MLKTRLIAAASAAAIAFAALSAPAFAANYSNTTKPAAHAVLVKKPVHHVVKVAHHHHFVSGKIVKINKAASTIKLSTGKTYHINPKAIGKFKVGQHVRLWIS